jgi:hypothetical protein
MAFSNRLKALSRRRSARLASAKKEEDNQKKKRTNAFREDVILTAEIRLNQARVNSIELVLRNGLPVVGTTPATVTEDF